MENKRPQLKARLEGNHYGEFTLEPLERGYGVTLGNPLRRILLSSIPGTAVTSVYIEDVLHEFSTIPGVKEDVIQIILNLKDLVVKFHNPGTGPKTLTLRVEGPKMVTAADFKGDDVEIVNPDLHIATLADDGRLVMEVRIEEGKGYVPADKHATKDRINSIPVDAIYTPVKRVAYHVEDTRVGQQTDLDRLVLRIWTDGCIDPKMALDKAVEILRNQLSVFSDGVEHISHPLPSVYSSISVEPMSPIVDVNPAPPPPDALQPKVTLEGLGLTTRVLHSLKEEGIDSVDALCALSDRDLKKVPGIGERSLDEIKQQLALYGLALKE